MVSLVITSIYFTLKFTSSVLGMGQVLILSSSKEDMKNPALAVLDLCPVDVIRKFINHSWQFMDAYWIPLSRKATVWAVCKQKGHCTVSTFQGCDDAPGCHHQPKLGT